MTAREELIDEMLAAGTYMDREAVAEMVDAAIEEAIATERLAWTEAMNSLIADDDWYRARDGRSAGDVGEAFDELIRRKNEWDMGPMRARATEETTQVRETKSDPNGI